MSWCCFSFSLVVRFWGSRCLIALVRRLGERRSDSCAGAGGKNEHEVVIKTIMYSGVGFDQLGRRGFSAQEPRLKKWKKKQ